MVRLIGVTHDRCGGQLDKEGSFELVPRDTSPDDSTHPYDVQHFDDGSSRVLCGELCDGVCRAVYCVKRGDVKRTGATASCPFQVGSKE